LHAEADWCGRTQAERALGAALRVLGRARSSVVVASKFGKHTALWETDDPTGGAAAYSPAEIRAAIETSLAALQVMTSSSSLI
jgi:aryl-alcohol dehydrogenase-like predicted oxidoreductase